MEDFAILFSTLIRKLREFHLVEYDSRTQKKIKHEVQLTQQAACAIEDLLGDIEELKAKIEILKEENVKNISDIISTVGKTAMFYPAVGRCQTYKVKGIYLDANGCIKTYGEEHVESFYDETTYY